MIKLLLTMKVKMFMNNPNSWKHIKYDKDCGHGYSYIEHPLVMEVDDHDDLICVLNEWLSENDDVPDCESDCCVCN